MRRNVGQNAPRLCMSVHLSDLSLEELIALCAEERTEGAWTELVARTRPAIMAVCGRVARRWGARDSTAAEELAQETYARLLASALRDFEPRQAGSGLAWLKVVAAGVSHDHFKLQAAQKRGGGVIEPNWDQTEATQPSAGPGADEILLLVEVERCLTAVAMGCDARVSRDLLIFQLHYRLGLSAEAIASIPAVELTSKGVESALARMLRQLRRRLAHPAAEDRAAAAGGGEAGEGTGRMRRDSAETSSGAKG